MSPSNSIPVHITTVDGTKITEPYGTHNRCDSCGMPINKARSIITGGQLCALEWACSSECHDEMVQKGCVFEELGDMTYRRQKY